MKITNLFTFLLLVYLFIGASVNAQPLFQCKIDGDEFNGKIEEASKVKIGNADQIQVKVLNGNKILFLYIKTSKIKGELPIKLSYVQPGENNETPDCELVWVPNQDEPQWNTIEGYVEITQFDESSNTISGKFAYVVEKMEYGSKKKKETLDIEEGKFSSIKYKVGN